MNDHPQAALERRSAARHLLQSPLTCKEHDPETFRLIRRHESDLDRWFTQRLGYRLHVDADTARLYKSGVRPGSRPFRATTGRPFHHLEYVLLALVLASTVSGPAVISLRDLVEQVRSAAVEADIEIGDGATERRALVAVLQWMIAAGLAEELHARVDLYSTDHEADAVLRLRPDRIALLPLPALTTSADHDGLLGEAARREGVDRPHLRSHLVEEPVLYRDDVTDDEWTELRRRLREEERQLDEMFGLVLEVRAEGMAAIDPGGSLSARRFPSGGTLGHAALLLLEELRDSRGTWVALAEVRRRVAELADRHQRRWANDLVANPDRLTAAVVDLLVELRLVEADDERPDTDAGAARVRLRPAAARFWATLPPDNGDVSRRPEQAALW